MWKICFKIRIRMFYKLTERESHLKKCYLILRKFTNQQMNKITISVLLLLKIKRFQMMRHSLKSKGVPFLIVRIVHTVSYMHISG